MTENTPSETAPKPAEHRRSNTVLVVTSVVGGVLLLAAIAAAAVAGILSLNRSGGEAQLLTADTRGVTVLEIRVGSAELSVVYDDQVDPDSAVLETSNGSREWELRRDGDTLKVDSDRGFFFPDWFAFGPDIGQTVVLRLPEAMRSQQLDADFELSSGSLSAEGDFGELDVEVSSGSLDVSGSARSFDADLSSGRLVFVLADVDEASLDTSSGDMSGEFRGAAPRSLEVGVSSGLVDLVLPDTSYAVSTHASSGSIENLLRTDPSSRNEVEVRVSSGGVTLRPAS